jgi:hypothetical protein
MIKTAEILYQSEFHFNGLENLRGPSPKTTLSK